jgi:hypothetical protein
MIQITSPIKKIAAIFALISLEHSLYARQLINGNQIMRDGNSFSFNSKAFCISKNNRIYFGAQEEVAKEFAVSFLNFGSTECKPFAFEKITLDTVKDQPNPLYNAAISTMQEIESNMIALVLQKNPTALYALSTAAIKGEVFCANNICDAQANPNGGIVSLASNNKGITFAAVKGTGQTSFGKGDCGIAIVEYHQETKKVEVTDAEIEAVKKKLKDASEEEIEFALKSFSIDEKGKKIKEMLIKTFGQVNATIPISVSSDFLKVGSDLAEIGTVTDIHWSPSLERLYIALQVKSNKKETDGARAVIVAHFDEKNKQLILHPIMDSTLLKAGYNHIVGAKGSNTQIHIHKIRTMQTTTGFLDYLIIVGGCGTSAQTKNRVYALPLLNFKDQQGIIAPEKIALHGTLASMQQKNTDGVMQPIIFEGFRNVGRSALFLGRHFCAIPQDAYDLFRAEHNTVQVGDLPLLEGTITDICVKDDAVYVLVDNTIYHSQALFDHFGCIIAWTQWQKIITTDLPLSTFLFDTTQSAHLLVTGDNPNTITRVQRMDWETAPAPLNSITTTINEQLKQDGGIQDLAEFFPFSSQPLLCALSSSKLIISAMNDMHYPTQCIEYTKGCIDTSTHAQSIAVSGGELDTICPLTSVAIATTDNQNLLFIGGTQGLAILAWPNQQEQLLSDIPIGSMIKHIGDYRFIRKLIADKQFLYILTDTYLDRLDITDFDATAGNITPVRLAYAPQITGQQYAIFYDCLISDQLCLLAHSNGLSRVGNSKDIRTDTQQTLDWKAVSIPNAGPVIALTAITQTGNPTDLASCVASQLYAITGSVSKNTARLNRFTIYNFRETEVCDTTIMPLNDYTAQNVKLGFANLGAYSSLFATDGSLFLTALNRKKSKNPALLTGFGKSRNAIPLKLDGASHITRIIRSKKWGNWLVAGDFGLVIND